MERYYLNLNKQDSPSGNNYEIHKITCRYCHPEKSNFSYLGYLSSEFDALIKAKRVYNTISKDIDGCFFCCKHINKK